MPSAVLTLAPVLEEIAVQAETRRFVFDLRA
jgi:hypothetical protein